MQRTAEEAQASIPMENVSDGSNLYPAFTMCRKAAKRTFPWKLPARELNLVSPPQAEDIPVTKKPRLEEKKPFSASTVKLVTKISSHGTALGLLAAAASSSPSSSVATHVDKAVKRTRTQSHWTPEQDAKLYSAVTNTSCRQKYGKEYRTDWAAVAARVPDRKKSQCYNRWHKFLDPSIDNWVENEDIKLKNAVQTHGGKMNWDAIAAQVPDRTKIQCKNRWHHVLIPSINRANARTGEWSAAEDSKLKDALQARGGKHWGAIAALVPGRTKEQCCSREQSWFRWHDAVDRRLDLTPPRSGLWWTTDEDRKLKFAIQMHDDKKWDAIAALVPDRSKMQCYRRWHDVVDPSIDWATGRAGTWATSEDDKLHDAVQMHGSNNWDAIAAVVFRRTRDQCMDRWNSGLRTRIAAYR
jgi:hypothetical protein